MAEFVLQVNGSEYKVETDPATPLLWVIRDHLNLTGTKFGCGMAQCGACTIHLDGNAVRSCMLPVSAATNKSITTIEGLSKDNNHPLQQAWIKHQVPQCGYCQSGQIMSAAALLEKKSDPTEDDINSAMRGNICRCGTYGRIKAAIVEAAKMKSNGNK
jgi:isoquinoline 1-oxidoreductase subunit alpha